MFDFDRAHSRWLDPEDPDTHWECSRCGRIFDGDDMEEVGDDIWLCEDCQETQTVLVVDRSEILPVVVPVEISKFCPICGSERGTPLKYTFFEDGVTYTCHTWKNSCGHVDTYEAILNAVAEGVHPSLR